MGDIILKEESYKIIGICMEVHRELGMGFKEIIYKDALEIEFNENDIPYVREKQFKVQYKGRILPRRFAADFVLYDSIILEVKSASGIVDDFLAQTINYLKVAITWHLNELHKLKAFCLQSSQLYSIRVIWQNSCTKKYLRTNSCNK